METMASPRPSIKPSAAISAPKKVVTKSGHTGYIISEPRSLKKEAKAKIATVFFDFIRGSVLKRGQPVYFKLYYYSQ